MFVGLKAALDHRVLCGGPERFLAVVRERVDETGRQGVGGRRWGFEGRCKCVFVYRCVVRISRFSADTWRGSGAAVVGVLSGKSGGEGASILSAFFRKVV